MEDTGRDPQRSRGNGGGKLHKQKTHWKKASGSGDDSSAAFGHSERRARRNEESGWATMRRVNQEDASTGRIREGDNRKDSKHNQHSRNSRPAQFARRRLASAEGGVDNQEEIQESQAHEESSGAHCKIEEVIVSNEELKKLLVGKVEAEAKERIADDPVCWIRSNLHLAQALWIPGNGTMTSDTISGSASTIPMHEVTQQRRLQAGSTLRP
uniref:Uncharacterized protein n=1 Tax=Pristionchus pacificus TaxID=54126 RepID=A0A2A6CHJ8_PRIPA|eukprot:PDM77704.1 hypothetical protein PRIPAC_34571 [Pristionchus pacificus]